MMMTVTTKCDYDNDYDNHDDDNDDHDDNSDDVDDLLRTKIFHSHHS